MKVKNIMFSGFMAVVLAGVCGAASAADNMTGDALIVASKGYVDTKLGKVNTALSDRITDLEDANKEGGDVANAIAAAQEAADNAQSDVNDLAGKMNLPGEYSDLSTALAAKEDTANKLVSGDIDLLNTDGTVNKDAVNALGGNDTKFPTVGAAVEIANAKAQQVLENVNSVSANLGTLTSKVDEHTASIQKLEGGDDVTGSVANAIKQSKDYADGLADNYDAAGSADQALADAKAYADGLATNYDAAGSATTAETNAKGYADGLVTAEKERAELAEQGLQTAIDTINNETNGILATAKAYTNSEMAKFYANAKDCVTSSDSHHCIMSAHADASGNPVYVWIDLTAPAE